MNVKFIAGQLGERRARFASSSHSAAPLAGYRRVSDFVVLTKPRVMMLAVFTALVGMSIAPGRLDPPTILAVVLAITVGAGAAGALNMNVAVAIDQVPQEALPSASEAGPAPKRIVVAYGFWIFLLSDIIMSLAWPGGT